MVIKITKAYSGRMGLCHHSVLCQSAIRSNRNLEKEGQSMSGCSDYIQGPDVVKRTKGGRTCYIRRALVGIDSG